MWFVALYVVIGLAWAFFDAGQVQHLDDQLRTRMPAGADMAALADDCCVVAMAAVGRAGLCGLQAGGRPLVRGANYPIRALDLRH